MLDFLLEHETTQLIARTPTRSKTLVATCVTIQGNLVWLIGLRAASWSKHTPVCNITVPTAVLEEHAIESLLQFARIMDIDFGNLDVVRAHADGRVYVFDANNTPCVRFVGVSAERRATIDQLATAFDNAFLRRRDRPLADSRAQPRSATSASLTGR